MNLIYESERPIGKNSLDDIVSLNQSDNETKEIDSTTFPSSNLNVASKCFEDELKSLRIKNINRVIMDQINISSIRWKFDDLIKRVSCSTDILMISETKVDASFPTSQFLIYGYTSP